MDAIKCLKTRRSIRFYKPDPIPAEILRQILEAASYAPSSKNSQPWEYYLLNGKEKDHICDLVVAEYPKRGAPFRKREENSPLKSATHLTAKNVDDYQTTRVMTNIGSTIFIRQAPVLILIFNKAPYTAGEENVIKEISKEALLAHTVEIESVSAFVFSLLLAAHNLGLGGCWIADLNFCRDKIKKYLGTKNDLVAGVVLGYPQEKILPKKINLAANAVKFWQEK